VLEQMPNLVTEIEIHMEEQKLYFRSFFVLLAHVYKVFVRDACRI
jgi:hypothetical protein